MQYANIMLALGGDNANVIPKYNCSAAEIAVLMAIHGEQAVSGVEPIEEKPEVGNRQELARLAAIYGNAKDSENNSILQLLYPGAGAVVHRNLADLGLVEEQFKAESRVKMPARGKPPTKAQALAKSATVEDLDELESDDEEIEQEEIDENAEPDFTTFTNKELIEFIGDKAEVPPRAKKDDLIAIAVQVQAVDAAVDEDAELEEVEGEENDETGTKELFN
jgi:hypothetical protein